MRVQNLKFVSLPVPQVI